MSDAIVRTWDDLRRLEMDKPYWEDLRAYLAKERASEEVLPAEDEVFAALEATPFDRVKVVILGQDPYPTPGHAHGLAFSVRPGVKIPHSLANIHKELESDLGVPRPNHGTLEHWARQGVLLLNTTLTVCAGAADSHRRAGWRHFTKEVVRALGSGPSPPSSCSGAQRPGSARRSSGSTTGSSSRRTRRRSQRTDQALRTTASSAAGRSPGPTSSSIRKGEGRSRGNCRT